MSGSLEDTAQYLREVAQNMSRSAEVADILLNAHTAQVGLENIGQPAVDKWSARIGAIADDLERCIPEMVTIHNELAEAAVRVEMGGSML